MNISKLYVAGFVIAILFIQCIQNSDLLTDADGNKYYTVKIGKQVWTAENLRTTKYNDGTSIPLDSSKSTWANATSPKYCYYNNDSVGHIVFGALYNWYVVNTKKLAPIGWHVPTDAEWDTLCNYLIANGYNWDGTTTGNKVAKSLAAKETFWTIYSSLGARICGAIDSDLSKNNKSNFSALPGGCRYNNGLFDATCRSAFWWSSSGIDDSIALYHYLFSKSVDFDKGRFYKSCGFSVRLVKD